LCFVGNFPGKTLDFFGRKVGLDHYGIDKPTYLVWYAVHQSVSTKKYPKLDLTGADIPLRNVSEALNYFWETHYEEHSISHDCTIYMPIFEASISSLKVENYGEEIPGSILVEFDIDPKRTKVEDLSCGIIAERKSRSFRDYSNSDSFRQQFSIDKYNLVDANLEFMPDSVSVYLNHKGKRIDEYNYHNYQPDDLVSLNPIPKVPEALGIEEAKQQDSLLDSELVSKMPKHIQSLLIEAENVYQGGHYRSTLILFRSVLDEGITEILKKLGMGEKLYDDKNYEMGLGQKIQMLTDYVQPFGKLKEELELIKWFGDKATHQNKMPFSKKDISDNLEPKLRLVLTKMVEELS